MSDTNDPYEALASARRIAVLGPSGSGKSFVATRLAEITGLPLIHLDRLAWQPGWRETDLDELKRIHRELLEDAEWVIDGNYTNVDKAERNRRADLVVVLAPPRQKCLRRAFSGARFSTSGAPDRTWPKGASNGSISTLLLELASAPSRLRGGDHPPGRLYSDHRPP